MASKPIVDVAPVSSLDATGYKDAESNDEFSGFYWTGIPSHISSGNLLYQRLPELTEDAVNKALDKHVEEVRERLSRDGQYSDLAPYYDVIQDEEELDMLHSGLFDVPARLQSKAFSLEYGDATQPPQGFLRKAALSGADDVSDYIKSNMDWALGEVVVSG
jgi:hypothetical protein